MTARDRLRGVVIVASGLTGLWFSFAPGRVLAAVDLDCFAGADSFTCDQSRVKDAEAVDSLFRPIIEKAGWNWRCYSVQYVRGDGDAAGTLLVSIRGPKGGAAPDCLAAPVAKLDPKVERQLDARGASVAERMKALAEQAQTQGAARAATDAELKKIGAELRRALIASPDRLRTRLMAKTGTLSLGSGYRDGVEISLQ